MIIEPTQWRQAAACRGLWELFYSERPADIDTAKGFCHSCPVFACCRQYIDRNPDGEGTWAGQSARERKRRARQRQRARRVLWDQLAPAMANEGNWTVVASYSRPRGGRERACVLRKHPNLPPGHWKFDSRAAAGGSELLALYKEKILTTD